MKRVLGFLSLLGLLIKKSAWQVFLVSLGCCGFLFKGADHLCLPLMFIFVTICLASTNKRIFSSITYNKEHIEIISLTASALSFVFGTLLLKAALLIKVFLEIASKMPDKYVNEIVGSPLFFMTMEEKGFLNKIFPFSNWLALIIYLIAVVVFSFLASARAKNKREEGSSYPKASMGIHSCILIGLIVVLAIGVKYTINTSLAKADSSESVWTIKGDKDLLSSLKVNYQIYGAKGFHHWNLEDSASITNVSYEKKQIFSEDVTAENRTDDYKTLSWGTSISGLGYRQDGENTQEEIKIFEPYIDLLYGEKEKTFEPIKINDYIENYSVHVSINGEGDNKEEQDDYIQYPIGDEYMASPYFYNINWDDKREQSLYDGQLKDETYRFDASDKRIGDKCYVIVSYEKVEGDSDKDFTDIYLVSEDSKKLLAQPKLVKHLEKCVEIIDMGAIDGKDFYTIWEYDRCTVNVINQDNFEVLQSFEIIIPENDMGYRSYGYPRESDNYNPLWTDHKMIRFKDDKIYLLTLMDVRTEDSLYKQALELLVYEENNSEPVADAIICNDLFGFTEGTRINNFDEGVNVYNYSLELQ